MYRVVPTLGELHFEKTRHRGCSTSGDTERKKSLFVQAWIDMEGAKADRVLAAIMKSC